MMGDPHRSHGIATIGRIAILLCLAIATLTACYGGGTSPRLATRRPAPPPEATPTELPPIDELARDGGFGVVLVAYNRIVDEHYSPVDEASLLDAAWSGVSRIFIRAGRSAPAGPRLTGDRAHDVGAFHDAWLRALPFVTNNAALRSVAIGSMAQSVDDCHTYFIPPASAVPFAGTLDNRGSVGVGIDIEGTPPIVSEVIPFSPAATAGMQPSDEIVSIDDEDASKFTPVQALRLLAGRDHTEVHVSVRRGGANAPLALTLTRTRVVPPNLTTRIIADAHGNIGYVRVRAWIEGGIAKQLRDALTRFESGSVRRWIIDLRGNGGGFPDEDASSLFVKDGIIRRERGRDGVPIETRSSGDSLSIIRPTVLLTNDGTASSSEMFAAALQEYGVAHVIGGKTAGCVGLTYIASPGDSSLLAVTRQVNFGPVTGALLNGVGIVPDETVEHTVADIVSGHDGQLDAAVAYLSQQTVR